MSARRSRRDGRHRGREAALQLLYQWEVGGGDLDQGIALYWELDRAPGADREFATWLARGTAAELTAIDPLVAASTRKWRIERLAVIDRLILRLATYELLHAPDTPPAVVIDEALELARSFSVAESVPFINGVLDDVKRRLAARA